MRLCTALVVVAFAANAHAQIATSTFDTDAEGWKFNDTLDFFNFLDPRWEPVGGNPDGHIQADDPSNGAMYFWAPDAYLGDVSSAFGHELSFDVATFGTGGLNEGEEDVFLFDPAVTLVLSLDIPGTPTDEWTHVAAPLDLSVPWFNEGEQRLATLDELQFVLGDLGFLGILGEFRFGADTGALDNVVLMPAPPTLLLVGFALATRRRR